MLNIKIPKTISLDEYTNFILKFMDDGYHFLGVHSKSVAAVSLKIAKELNIKGINRKNLKYGALLHDIGKIYMPKDILLAPRKLSDNEFEIIKEHPEKGYKIVNGFNAFADVNGLILAHHYRNGFGYPKKIAIGYDALLVDILTVSDSYSAIMEKRYYNGQDSMDDFKALAILRDEKDERNFGINCEVVDVLEQVITKKSFKTKTS